MKSVSISGSLRENVGKKDAKAQRKQDLVPCVVYGGEKQYHILVETKQFKSIIYTPETRYAELTFGDKKMNAIIQASQFHPVTEALIHIDFLEVSDKKPITIPIPINIIGTSPGVLRGGKLIKKYRKLRVNGLLKNIPEMIDISISELDIDQSFKVSDVVTSNFEIMENKANVVVAVVNTREVVAEEVAK